jgi:competence protein ComEC
MEEERNKKKLFNWLLAILFLVTALIYSQVYYIYAQNNQVKIFFLDIGQGDSILIDFGKNQQALIDGGPSKAVLTELGKYLPIGDRTIEYMILTHPDSDHLTGLNYVLESYQVEKIYHTGVNHDTNRYQEFRDKIKSENTEIADYGDVIKPNKTAKIEIIYPLISLNNQNKSNLNDSSIVAVLDIGKVEILLTGDGEENVWQELISKNLLKDVEILKVSHHGASNGTNEELLKTTKPELAIISAGKDNRYGHPKKDVLNLLEEHQLNIKRTDQEGTIKLTTDGENYWVD